MTNINALSVYSALNQALSQQQIGLTASELHGLLSGILCGGNRDDSWRTLLYSLTNEGAAYSHPLSQLVESLYDATKSALADEHFSFHPLMPEEGIDLFEQIDNLAGWVNHFLLGLGVTVPKLDKVTGDVGEVIDDLRGIGQLGYDEEDSAEELEQALTEVTEYVRMAAMLCYNEFKSVSAAARGGKPTIH